MKCPVAATGVLSQCCVFVFPRKRVALIMNSKEFREELEQLVTQQMGYTPANNTVLQQLSELIMPQYKLRQSSVFSRGQYSVPPYSSL